MFRLLSYIFEKNDITAILVGPSTLTCLLILFLAYSDDSAVGSSAVSVAISGGPNPLLARIEYSITDALDESITWPSIEY